MSSLFPTYNRFDVKVAEAYGSIVIDESGKKYLDFGAGIGVCNLGHRHPKVQEALENQLNKYWHVSNLYYVPLQEKVAKLLVDHSDFDQVFFCNSGAEANEAAIKLARKATGKEKIITFNQSFHGRTFATMSATGQDKIHQGFGPLLATFEYVPFNDIEAVKKAIDSNTAAIMLEVVQGEGGISVADVSFLKDIEQLCEEHEVLFIIDEIQTGIGRTGKLFAHQHFNIQPDIITSAKGLGNGIPVGAMMAKQSLSSVFGPGTHGTTFGGNPLAMAASEVVLEHVIESSFLQEVSEKGNYLLEQLKEKVGQANFVKEIRGKGLMIGINCHGEVSALLPKLIEKGLLVLNAGPNVIRLLPPLTVTKEEIDQAVALLKEVIHEVSTKEMNISHN